MSIVSQIVARCHVGDSNMKVIRYLVSRMSRGYTTWASLAHSDRRRLMREAIRAHADNRKLYNRVMRGV